MVSFSPEFEVECTGRLAKTSGLKLKQDKHTGRRNLGRLVIFKSFTPEFLEYNP